MPEQKFQWKNSQIRKQIEVLTNHLAPTVVLKNATYLNSYLRQWMKANIWIYEDRIVYVGDKLPEQTFQMEVIDCASNVIVPGYIEPHAHPFQLYNPQSLARYVSQTGTTTFIGDNLFLLLQSSKKKALTFMDDMEKLPYHYFWWARFDLQTEVHSEEKVFSHDFVRKWLEHKSVLQGGELTGWPKLADGDDWILYWLQETKRRGKRIEGHFPGASKNTLTKMKLFGVDSDHESMTGKDVMNRLKLGYTAALRQSSIRPDLEKLLKEVQNEGLSVYDHVYFTTDGSTPTFYENGMINTCIDIALDCNVPAIDAYHMASFNIARYYQLEDRIGVIAPGRMATLNILENIDNPDPLSVMSKGKWLVKNREIQQYHDDVDWGLYGLEPAEIKWDLLIDDLQFSMPMGMKMRNAVIMEPYSVTIDSSSDVLSEDHDESFLALIDRNGEWRINTVIKGFSKKVQGFASSYSTTGDIIVIGKNKKEMLSAFARMKDIGGGIVLTEDERIIFEMPLKLNGGASQEVLEKVITKQKELNILLKERGYRFDDPIYSLLFLSSTHLPYIRITPRGIFDVMKKTVLFPSIMR
ncbi:adenine deaminase C-terminal domain-containing protein [Metabacillus halosaccharovorans]|uniref:adenine deaminase C-terminal domain-containing protein n=1 Tax=Metabacillus halosaccharovorans TaxID=930124 RepID=UPI0020402610|nr:adenine deaminase C-terminal domain-containing protein [Metabacillus halosaccharovorans]MCM3444524.1 amidohydrolase family protein [Metabacillus halosaccharovorans]